MSSIEAHVRSAELSRDAAAASSRWRATPNSVALAINHNSSCRTITDMQGSADADTIAYCNSRKRKGKETVALLRSNLCAAARLDDATSEEPRGKRACTQRPENKRIIDVDDDNGNSGCETDASLQGALAARTTRTADQSVAAEVEYLDDIHEEQDDMSNFIASEDEDESDQELEDCDYEYAANTTDSSESDSEERSETEETDNEDGTDVRDELTTILLTLTFRTMILSSNTISSFRRA